MIWFDAIRVFEIYIFKYNTIIATHDVLSQPYQPCKHTSSMANKRE